MRLARLPFCEFKCVVCVCGEGVGEGGISVGALVYFVDSAFAIAHA